MDSVTTSSSTMVQNRLISMIRNIKIPDDQIAREILEYFAEHGGSGAGAGSFLYNRNGAPAAAWIIQHNLNKYPQVTLIDDDGNLFEADIFYSNLNQVTVVFAEPTSGKAVLV